MKERTEYTREDLPCRLPSCGAYPMALLATIGGRRYEFPIDDLAVADIRAANIYRSFPDTRIIEVMVNGKVVDTIEWSNQ